VNTPPEKDTADREFHVPVGHRNRDLDREQPKQGRELDHGIERDRRGILERIANGVANHRRGVQFRPLLAEVHFDDLLCIIPGPARIGHEDGLEQAEECDPDQVANEEIGIEKWQREREAEDDDEDVPHAFLRVNGADAHDLLAVLFRRGRCVELHVLLDVDHGAIGTSDHRLTRGSGKPIDHGTAHDQPQDNLGLHNAQLGNHPAE
jgi:hypothetical protein